MKSSDDPSHLSTMDACARFHEKCYRSSKMHNMRMHAFPTFKVSVKGTTRSVIIPDRHSSPTRLFWSIPISDDQVVVYFVAGNVSTCTIIIRFHVLCVLYQRCYMNLRIHFPVPTLNAITVLIPNYRQGVFNALFSSD